MYQYKELLEKALETRSFKDMENLADWFRNYGSDFWNGEYWDLGNDYRLYPIYQDAADDEFEIVDYEIR